MSQGRNAIRLIDAGLVGPSRSQSLYHAVAHVMTDQTPDTIITVGPTDPYVCIGLFQDLKKEVDVAYCRAHELPIVRREVGGGAVYLDKNQIFAQWVFHASHLPARLEERIEHYVRPLVATYRELGIEAYLRPVNDVHVAGRKIGGTGSARIGEAAVVVGSFMLDFDRAAMARVLRVSSEKMRDKVAQALEDYIVTMSDLMPEVPCREELLAVYLSRCEEALGRNVAPGELTQDELDKADALDGLLTSVGWLGQKGGQARPDVKVHEDVRVVEATHKAPGGLIRVTARLCGGVLDDLELSGDFALEPDSGLAALEKALVGCALEPDAVELAVADTYVSRSLQSPGVTPGDIVTAVLLLID